MTGPRERLAEYVLGLLPPEEMAEMERLIEASPALKGEADDISAALTSMASALDPVAPSKGTRRRLLDHVAALPGPSPARARSPGTGIFFAAPPPVWMRPGRQPAAASGPGQAAETIAAVAGVVAIGVLALVAVYGLPDGLLRARSPALAALLMAQVTGLWAALAPRRSVWAPVSWGAAALGAALALAGHAGAVTDSPGWICSVIQGLGGLAPLALVLRALRGRPFEWWRSISAGVALGTAGAIWGEIGCQRGALHVLAHHGGSWLVLLAACVLASRLATAPRRAP
jgi:hypothetical protein